MFIPSNSYNCPHIWADSSKSHAYRVKEMVVSAVLRCNCRYHKRQCGKKGFKTVTLKLFHSSLN